MGNYEIMWSPNARITFAFILTYLQENWPEKVVEDFIDRTDKVLAFVSENPFMYTHHSLPDVYKCVVVKQISLFYDVKSDRDVELLFFWDNRQSPSDLLLLLA